MVWSIPTCYTLIKLSEFWYTCTLEQPISCRHQFLVEWFGWLPSWWSGLNFVSANMSPRSSKWFTAGLHEKGLKRLIWGHLKYQGWGLSGFTGTQTFFKQNETRKMFEERKGSLGLRRAPPVTRAQKGSLKTKSIVWYTNKAQIELHAPWVKWAPGCLIFFVSFLYFV